MGWQTGWYCLKLGNPGVHFSKSLVWPANSRWSRNMLEAIRNELQKEFPDWSLIFNLLWLYFFLNMLPGLSSSWTFSGGWRAPVFSTMDTGASRDLSQGTETARSTSPSSQQRFPLATVGDKLPLQWSEWQKFSSSCHTNMLWNVFQWKVYDTASW
jgi:hypothetical protein